MAEAAANTNMAEVDMTRVKSMVPCTCTNTESTVINQKIGDLWNKFRHWKFEELAPSIVASTEWTDGASGRVDSTVKVTYVNGAVWYWRVTMLNERDHSIAYELVAAEPSITVSSIVGEISLRAVTDADQTFVQWSTEYSNDVDADFIGDARWKKRDFFAAIKAALAQ